MIFPPQGMLTNDVVAIDCKSPGYPCFKNPYAMDFNDSPVTCCKYVVDCPADLICALYKVFFKVSNIEAHKIKNKNSHMVVMLPGLNVT